MIAAILTFDPRPVSQLVPTSPAALDHVVTSCLAKDPDERWQSVSDLSRELRWIFGGTGAVAATTAPVETAAATTPRTGQARVAWIVAAVASIAAVASLAVHATHTRPTVSPGALTRSRSPRLKA